MQRSTHLRQEELLWHSHMTSKLPSLFPQSDTRILRNLLISLKHHTLTPYRYQPEGTLQVLRKCILQKSKLYKSAQIGILCLSEVARRFHLSSAATLATIFLGKNAKESQQVASRWKV